MDNSNFKFPLIIAIVGDFSSGKQTIAKYLKETHNFEILMNYSEFSNLTESEFDNELNDVINKIKSQDISKSKTIKQKIREVESNYTLIYPYLSYEDYSLLSNKSCFRLLNIVCPTKIKFNNFMKKNPNSNFEKFLDVDYEVSTNQDLNNVRNMANFTINNDSTLENLFEKISILITQLKTHFRPSWQDYFMSVANIVAQRSNCVKQKVGTVIVKDGRILATGYNGTPSGLANCYEGGCERCNLNIEQGIDLDKCFCLHSEENAV